MTGKRRSGTHRERGEGKSVFGKEKEYFCVVVREKENEGGKKEGLSHEYQDARSPTTQLRVPLPQNGGDVCVT